MSDVKAVNINIAPGDTRPIFKQIVDGIRMQIACGNLPVGAKLPSVRGLAMQLTINANTVAKAYTELTNQGLVEARQGLGLFVSQPRQQLNIEEQRKRLGDAVQAFVNDVAYLDFSAEQITEKVSVALNQLATNKENETRNHD
ncbi:GntR family transcriptional regulator [Paraglaciecola arctica]|uniref:GntR family transcriptional regulator n=1 Tax=Paraglaciecola arctica TaxID=1128911 RepID=UPI001C07BAF5|nr:GntR family transcriptional regulator [Paraglaciecola arctica]MBU3003563.1 GntR family transcriptional regulator [Paraglaciecola arctica]